MKWCDFGMMSICGLVYSGCVLMWVLTVSGLGVNIMLIWLVSSLFGVLKKFICCILICVEGSCCIVLVRMVVVSELVFVVIILICSSWLLIVLWCVDVYCMIFW